MNIYKLLLGILVLLTVALGGPYLLAHFGLMPVLNEKAWLLLGVTSMGLCLKCLVGDVVAGEFLFYKFGYDNCIMSLGAILTALAMQLVSTTDLFLGVDSIAFIRNVPRLSADAAANRSVQLLLLLLLALVATLITASVSKAIKQKSAKGPDFLSLLNFVIGTSLLGIYILVLITKG